MKLSCAGELKGLRAKCHDSSALKAIRKWLHNDASDLPMEHREKVGRVFASSPMLTTTWKMRQELTRLWERSTLTTEQLVHQLKDWCDRAERSEVPALVAFSRRLRCYA